MSVELLYTSAPQGLKQGSRGFCTVISTAGLPINLATRLESLSAYRHVFPPQDPSASQNPVCFSHLRVNVGGRQVSILSRIAAYGVDYSSRTNKIAHHVVLDANERVPCGPAYLMQGPSFFEEIWDGQCETRAVGPRIPQADVSPAICTTWEQVKGDAGWGGVVAEAFSKPMGKPIWIIFRLEQSQLLMQLIAEAIAVLPPAQRWNATFSTYFTNLPPDIDCKVRCVLEGTDEARLAPAKGTVIELYKRDEIANDAALVFCARQGIPLINKAPEGDSSPAKIELEPSSEFELPMIRVTNTFDELTLTPPSITPKTQTKVKDAKRPMGLPPTVFPNKQHSALAIASFSVAVLALLVIIVVLVIPMPKLVQNASATTQTPVGQSTTVQPRKVNPNDGERNTNPDVSGQALKSSDNSVQIDKHVEPDLQPSIACADSVKVKEGENQRLTIGVVNSTSQFDLRTKEEPPSWISLRRTEGNTAEWTLSVEAPNKLEMPSRDIKLEFELHHHDKLLASKDLTIIVENQIPTISVSKQTIQLPVMGDVEVTGNWSSDQIADPVDQLKISVKKIVNGKEQEISSPLVQLQPGLTWSWRIAPGEIQEASGLQFFITDNESAEVALSELVTLSAPRIDGALDVIKLVGKDDRPTDTEIVIQLSFDSGIREANQYKWLALEEPQKLESQLATVSSGIDFKVNGMYDANSSHVVLYVTLMHGGEFKDKVLSIKNAKEASLSAIETIRNFKNNGLWTNVFLSLSSEIGNRKLSTENQRKQFQELVLRFQTLISAGQFDDPVDGFVWIANEFPKQSSQLEELRKLKGNLRELFPTTEDEKFLTELKEFSTLDKLYDMLNNHHQDEINKLLDHLTRAERSIEEFQKPNPLQLNLELAHIRVKSGGIGREQIDKGTLEKILIPRCVFVKSVFKS